MVEWIDVDVVVDEGIEGDVEDKRLLTESIDAVRILSFLSVEVLKSETESISFENLVVSSVITSFLTFGVTLTSISCFNWSWISCPKMISSLIDSVKSFLILSLISIRRFSSRLLMVSVIRTASSS